MKILISSRSDEALASISQRVRQAGYGNPDTRLLVNGDRDPVSVGSRPPDVLVLHAGEHIAQHLSALAERSGDQRPALIVVGEHLPTEAMKFAMRAGARDFVADLASEELPEALARLDAEIESSSGRSQVVAVINAKGGAGASFIAANLAHLAVGSGDDTVLIDLDFQYGSLAHYLDLKPRRSLVDALRHVDELDATAVSAYVSSHESGVDLLASTANTGCLSVDGGEGVATLLEILGERYRRVVVDVPRHIDRAGIEVLRRADVVLLVLQQSLLAVNDAVRLKSILIDEVGMPSASLISVVNRHSKRSMLEMRDLTEAMGGSEPALIPNQYQIASECAELGVFLAERAPNAPISKALAALQARVMGVPLQRERSLLSRIGLRG